MADNPPSRPTDEKRKGPRRTGIGRRILGERRMNPLSEPPAGSEAELKARQKQRRARKRRVLPDRRGH